MSAARRHESGPDACERLGLPYAESDDPVLWAMARVMTERIGYRWDALPFHDLEADVSQTYYLLLAKGEREGLRALGFDVVESQGRGRRSDASVPPHDPRPS